MERTKHALPSSIDLINLAKKNGYNLKIHDQGENENCIIFAFTSMHEIIRRRYFKFEDLLVGSEWMNDIGALMVDVATKLELSGQNEQEIADTNENTLQFSNSRPKRRCRVAHRLKCEQLPLNIAKCKQRLSIGIPLVISTHEFSFSVSQLSVANRKTDKKKMDSLHCVCVYGFEDDAQEEGGGRFLLINSHGEQWGNQGQGSITYEFFSTFVYQVWSAHPGHLNAKTE